MRPKGYNSNRGADLHDAVTMWLFCRGIFNILEHLFHQATIPIFCTTTLQQVNTVWTWLTGSCPILISNRTQGYHRWTWSVTRGSDVSGQSTKRQTYRCLNSRYLPSESNATLLLEENSCCQKLQTHTPLFHLWVLELKYAPVRHNIIINMGIPTETGMYFVFWQLFVWINIHSSAIWVGLDPMNQTLLTRASLLLLWTTAYQKGHKSCSFGDAFNPVVKLTSVLLLVHFSWI